MEDCSAVGRDERGSRMIARRRSWGAGKLVCLANAMMAFISKNIVDGVAYTVCVNGFFWRISCQWFLCCIQKSIADE